MLFWDKDVDMLAVSGLDVQITVEIPLLQFFIKVVDMPVDVQ